MRMKSLMIGSLVLMVLTVVMAGFARAVEPVAHFLIDPNPGEVFQNISFDGSGSTGELVLYEYNFDGDSFFDWSSATSGNTSFVYGASGTYNVVFRVTESSGAYDEMSQELVITERVIPEPSTLIIWSLLGTLAITCGWWRRRKAA